MLLAPAADRLDAGLRRCCEHVVRRYLFAFTERVYHKSLLDPLLTYLVQVSGEEVKHQPRDSGAILLKNEVAGVQ